MRRKSMVHCELEVSRKLSDNWDEYASILRAKKMLVLSCGYFGGHRPKECSGEFFDGTMYLEG